MTYSIHFRKKVLADMQRGDSRQSVASRYRISKSTVHAWINQLEPKGYSEREPTKIKNVDLQTDIDEYSSDYQHERALRFGCTQAAICYALKRINTTRKKTVKTSKS